MSNFFPVTLEAQAGFEALFHYSALDGICIGNAQESVNMVLLLVISVINPDFANDCSLHGTT